MKQSKSIERFRSMIVTEALVGKSVQQKRINVPIQASIDTLVNNDMAVRPIKVCADKYFIIYIVHDKYS